MKIEITATQVAQFNYMRNALIRIAKDYQNPAQLRKNSVKQYGLDFEECIEMVYENIQREATIATNGVKPIQIKNEGE